MTLVEILRGGRARYAANPSHADGYTDIEPGCECIITALSNAADPLDIDGFIDAYMQMVDVAGTRDIVAWNVAHSTEQVLAAFDEAIARAGDLSVLFGSGDVEVGG